MEFFSNLNFTRVVILTSLVASAVLSWLVYDKTAELDELEREVSTSAPLLVNSIQKLAVKYQHLEEQLDLDQFITLDDPETYIRRIAQQDQVNVGDVKISPSDKTVRSGVKDYFYRIEPIDKKRAYELDFISNFIYRLEEKSRRVKVTQIKLDPVDRMKPDEYGKRRNWTFNCTLTSRQADEQGGS